MSAVSGIRRALVLTTAERYFYLVVNFGTLAVISRLLTPAEIGVSVLGIAIATFVQSIREFATTNYIVQRPGLQAEDVRVAFTVLLTVSLLAAGILLLAGPFLATAYAEPGLRRYLAVLALATLLETVSGVVAAQLRRQMAFDRLALINVTAATVNAGLLLSLVAAGFSYMSFAWAALGGALALAALSLAVWPDWSVFRPRLRGARAMLVFGGYNGVNVMLYRVYEALPYVVLGRLLPIESVALYNRSIVVAQLPDKMLLGGLVSVLLSAFSAEVRKGENLRHTYLRAIELITGVHWPALVLVAVLADPIVRIVLGPQWIAIVPLVQVLAIAGMFAFSNELNYPVLMAVGAMREIMVRSLVVWPVSALVITLAALGGLQAAVLAWLLVVPFQSFLSVSLVKRHVDMSWREFAAATKRSALVTVCASLGPLCVLIWAGGGAGVSVALAAVAIAAAGLGWLAGLALTTHPLLVELRHVMGRIWDRLIARWPLLAGTTALAADTRPTPRWMHRRRKHGSD